MAAPVDTRLAADMVADRAPADSAGMGVTCNGTRCSADEECIPGCVGICICMPAPDGGVCPGGPCLCGRMQGCAYVPPNRCASERTPGCRRTDGGILCQCA
jgi:hypothetical protein